MQEYILDEEEEAVLTTGVLDFYWVCVCVREREKRGRDMGGAG